MNDPEASQRQAAYADTHPRTKGSPFMSARQEQDITEDEVLAELQRLSQTESDAGLTTAEWALKLRVAPRTASGMLARAKAVGMLVVGRGFREALDGRRSQVPVYTVRPKT
jgi:hypothetical protein